MAADAFRLDPAWLRALGRRAAAPPERPRVPLRLDPSAGAIGTIEPELAVLLADSGVPLRAAAGGWDLERPAGTAVDAALAALARVLHERGIGGAWRDELLAVCTDTGARVGAIERAAVRPLGIATDAVHLVAHRADGNVWVQRRAATKSTDPGAWDTTVGGLIADGESLAVALARETWEEAGLRTGMLRGLQPCGRFTVRRPLERGYMVERSELFEAALDDAVVPVNQDGEVERFECLSRRDLLERLHADAFTLEAALALAAWLGQPATDGR